MPTLTRWKIWLKMVFSKSDLHVNQPLGSYITCDHISGYYNDLSEKVLFDKKHKETIDYIPLFLNDYGKKVIFPIQIIQYALGCNELFYKTKNSVYCKKMLFCSDYILDLMNNDGSISCMYFVKGLGNPFSAMCQGECISLLSRAFVLTNNKKYFEGALRAYRFLVDKSNINAVVKKTDECDYCFYEYPEKEIVLNGYIFALFGVYDAFLLTQDINIYQIYKTSLNSLNKIINMFDCNGWSYYDLNKNYASKFYHKLHISLLDALNLLSSDRFIELRKKWEKGLQNKQLSRRMFWAKAKQKLTKK